MGRRPPVTVGLVPARVSRRGQPRVLVPEFYWQCIVFLCQANDEGKRIPRGTAFFVSSPIGTTEVVYVVTAGHNIELARSAGRPLYLRLNRRDGTVEDVEMADHDVWVHSFDTDLAACLFPAERFVEYQAQGLLPVQFASVEDVAAQRIGPGDEVFFCGLFSEHPGLERSQPIVRWGNVSMMPGEKVRVTTPEGGTRYLDAYLVEARSWGGQSGSPAFVYFPPDRELGVLQMPRWQGEPGAGGKMNVKELPLLLGVVQGHFDIRQDVAFTSDFETDAAYVKVNSGIAVVIPAQRVIDLLDEPEFLEAREAVATRGEASGHAAPSEGAGPAGLPVAPPPEF